MPLYLVRWADLAAAVVKAADEDDLLDQLDMVGNSTGARWTNYDGPLHIEFDLKIPFELKEPRRSTADLVFGAFPEEPLRSEASVAESDVGAAFLEALHEFAFPNLQSACAGDPPSEESLAAAAAADLQPFLQASWQREQLARSGDPDAAMALQLGADLKWIKSVRRRCKDEPLCAEAGDRKKMELP